MMGRSGKITATEGARRLGISRKTYYQWEQRGLAGMMSALEDGPSGRPAKRPDPKIRELESANEELKLEKDILHTRLQIQQIIHEEQTGQLSRQRGSTRTGKKKDA